MEKVDYWFMQSAEEAFSFKPKILELGARIIENQDGLAIRNIFAGKNTQPNYTGVDYIDGPGVDCVANVEVLPMQDGDYSTVIAMNLFEHVERFWLVFPEIKRVLAENGVVVCATPFNYEIHGCPYDYYRFTPDFYRNQFKEFRYAVEVLWGDEVKPKMVYFMASNSETLPRNYETFKQLFQERMKRASPAGRGMIDRLRARICGNHVRGAILCRDTLTFKLHVNSPA